MSKYQQTLFNGKSKMFELELIADPYKQNDSTHTSTISFEFVFYNLSSPYQITAEQFTDLILMINGKNYTVKPDETRLVFRPNESQSFSIVYYLELNLKHFGDGTLPMSVSIVSGSFKESSSSGRSQVYQYNTLPKIREMTVPPLSPYGSNLVFNSTIEIGKELPITVSNSMAGLKQDITLQYSSATGEAKELIIARGNVAEQINWFVPTELGSSFPTTTSKAANIQCVDKGEKGEVFLTKNYPCLLTIDSNKAIPAVDLVVTDINPNTVALTGDSKTLILKQSRVQYEIKSTPKYGATIVSYYIQNKDFISNSPTGIIEKLELPSFDVKVKDSRGFENVRLISPAVVMYSLPTISLSNNKPDVSGNYIVNTSGKWFNKTFGAVANTLTVQYRMKERSSSVEGEWITIPHTIDSQDSNSYKAIYTVTGLDYRKTYVFQTRVIDKLSVAESSAKTVKALPVFDWGENEVNFNVPIEMKETQVLDINEDTKDVTLSGGGELIHIRPRSKGSTLKELTVGGDELLYNGKPIGGGTVDVPIATVTVPGIVRPDGSTITVDSNGVISAAGGGGGGDFTKIQNAFSKTYELTPTYKNSNSGYRYVTIITRLVGCQLLVQFKAERIQNLSAGRRTEQIVECQYAYDNKFSLYPMYENKLEVSAFNYIRPSMGIAEVTNAGTTVRIKVRIAQVWETLKHFTWSFQIPVLLNFNGF